ncbi:methyltransferase [Aurantibacillus circumpalustris]|uniref:methyltransferase n=1 Tax=Aurantibacillus circumpalustris TaxID=3036359 RepID=UPI00295AC719|nr:methyltransferase [Aurantibacillus circumpalustris]
MISKLDEKYWSDRYRNNDFGWDTGAITNPLKKYFDQLSNKEISILIPGAGNAYEAEYLVNNGFTNVYVCDLSEEPLKNLKKRCPAFKNENLLLLDFFKLRQSPFEQSALTFDLIVEQTFFCALNPSLRKKYFEKMSTLLNPGGRLVGVLFDDVLNKDHPPFGGNKEEYLAYIDSSFKIKTFEKCYNSIKPRENRELFINLVRTV